MWAVRDLARKLATLDFSSSGQASRTVTQIVVDGLVFANAAELSSWDQPRVQVHVCEDCGVEQCASGGWLVPRNVGIGVAFVPDFDEMLVGDWERMEYAPPDFARGLPVFQPDDYVRLRRLCGGLPAIEVVPVVTGVELLRCFQWDAPAQVLGRFPAEVQLHHDLLLAVSDGEVSEAAAILEDALRWIGGRNRVRLTPVPSTAHTITLYLDAPGTPEWTPLCTIDGDVRLAAPLPGHLVATEDDSGGTYE